MTTVTLYHNPRCSKSRAALALLQERGADVQIVRYLDQPLGADAIGTLLACLNLPAAALLRRGEAAYRELGLGPDTPDAEAIAAMVAEPKLIERPVAVVGKRAVIGRPPENVLDLLG